MVERLQERRSPCVVKQASFPEKARLQQHTPEFKLALLSLGASSHLFLYASKKFPDNPDLVFRRAAMFNISDEGVNAGLLDFFRRLFTIFCLAIRGESFPLVTLSSRLAISAC